VLDYWVTKHRLLSAHGATKQAMDCQLHILSLLPDTDISSYMEIVRDLVKVTDVLMAFPMEC